MRTIFQSAAEVRILVGYLAEQHAAWLGSQFFGPRASAFLAPVFARTAFQAQCNGVTAGAARLHDEVIGIGRTYHLFRMTEVLEQGVAIVLANPALAEQIEPHLKTPSTALSRLEALARPGSAIEGAQVIAGDFIEGGEALLKSLAGIYLDAFRKRIKTFPFVREA